MKTPTFWNKKNLVYYFLLPLGWLYHFATALKIRLSKSYKSSVPVICIGNLTAGGTGKTPISIAIADIVKNKRKNPFFISRGYGGKVKNIIIHSYNNCAKEVGDEPLLLSKIAPVAVNPDRAEAAKLAIKSGADILIMDDGFQNPGLYKDISFLVFNGKFGIGNGGIIPAGPLRETFASGIKRASALIIIGNDETNIAKKTDLPVFFADITEEQPNIKNKNVFAFAGIGYPEKFYNSLKNVGLNIIEKQDFPDHHFYAENELNKIIETAKKQNLEIFTTSKDYVKIPADMQKYFNVLNIKIKWHDEKSLTDFIWQKLG